MTSRFYCCIGSLICGVAMSNAGEPQSCVSGFEIRALVSGLDEPVGVSSDGSAVVVVDSASAIASSSGFGRVLRVESSGAFIDLGLMPDCGEATCPGLPGPSGIAAGSNGLLYVGLEDSEENPLSSANPDRVAIFDASGSEVGSLVCDNEARDVALGSQTFGNAGDVYYTGRIEGITGPFRVANGAGIFPIHVGGAELTGSAGIAFGTGGTSSLGTDLYVTTFADTFDSSSADGIYRVTPGGTGVLLVVPPARTLSLVATPHPDGPFGDYLFVASFDGIVRRVAADGTLMDFATIGTGDRLQGIGFSPWGSLVVSNTSGGVVYEIVVSPCSRSGTPNGVDVLDLLDFLPDWFAGSSGADYDRSGVVDVLDLLEFISCWFTHAAA